MKGEIRGRADILTQDYRVVFDSADLRARTPRAEFEPRARFSVRTPVSILEELVGNTPIRQVISGLTKRSLKSSWEAHTTDLAATVTTPLGFGFRLEVEPGQR